MTFMVVGLVVMKSLVECGGGIMGITLTSKHSFHVLDRVTVCIGVITGAHKLRQWRNMGPITITIVTEFLTLTMSTLHRRIRTET